ncbi:hypothetical protein GN958_ATG20396 [Phytophthora infestans]|uniref:Uncharacterized protein n=1 Tax=Phytophthora infestans TaxID=4787 RepID=A0A8S9TUI4_PHYIN|nr:hypothetical protein GN958_ATG20396 [Phytophthora infestans]
MYRDRHGADLEDDDLESLHFTKRSNMESSTENSTLESTMDLSEVCNSNAAPMMSEVTLEATRDLEEGEDDTAQRVKERDEVMTELREAQQASLPSRASAKWTGLEGIEDTVTEPPCVPDVEGVTAGLPSALTALQSEQYHNQSDDLIQSDGVNSEGSASKLTTVYGYTKPDMTSDNESAVSMKTFLNRL